MPTHARDHEHGDPASVADSGLEGCINMCTTIEPGGDLCNIATFSCKMHMKGCPVLFWRRDDLHGVNMQCAKVNRKTHGKE